MKTVVPTIPRQSKLKDTIVTEFGHPHSQVVEKALTYPGRICLLAVTLRKGAQMGSLTLEAAD